MSYQILIVDDSRTARLYVQKALKLSGVPLSSIHQAGNGLEALEVLGEQWIDLVFSDINMPEMDGIELIDRMREKDETQSIPVVVISSEDNEKRRNQLEERGIETTIQKPFEPELIREIVQSRLEVKTNG